MASSLGCCLHIGNEDFGVSSSDDQWTILAVSTILVFPTKGSPHMLLSTETNSETFWINQIDTDGVAVRFITY
ncbi:unnamed protein product [Absidia cylindrospora]